MSWLHHWEKNHPEVIDFLRKYLVNINEEAVELFHSRFSSMGGKDSTKNTPEKVQQAVLMSEVIKGDSQAIKEICKAKFTDKKYRLHGSGPGVDVKYNGVVNVAKNFILALFEHMLFNERSKKIMRKMIITSYAK